MHSKTNTCFNLTKKQVNGNNETFRRSSHLNVSMGSVVNLEMMEPLVGPLVGLRNVTNEVSKGLSPQRIEKFEHFTADESLVGEQCLICMNDLEIGMEMVRLYCHVDHILCKVCVEKWFKNHKTCPTCRQAF